MSDMARRWRVNAYIERPTYVKLGETNYPCITATVFPPHMKRGFAFYYNPNLLLESQSHIVLTEEEAASWIRHRRDSSSRLLWSFESANSAWQAGWSIKIDQWSRWFNTYPLWWLVIVGTLIAEPAQETELRDFVARRHIGERDVSKLISLYPPEALRRQLAALRQEVTPSPSLPFNRVKAKNVAELKRRARKKRTKLAPPSGSDPSADPSDVDSGVKTTHLKQRDKVLYAVKPRFRFRKT